MLRMICEGTAETFRHTVVYGRTVEPSSRTERFLRDASFDFVHVPSLVRPVSPVADLQALRALGRVLAERSPDLVHTHTAKAGVLGRFAARRLGLPVVHMPHGHNFQGYAPVGLGWTVRWVERVLARCTALLLVFSRSVAEDYVRLAGVPREKILVIPSGIEPAEVPDAAARLSARRGLDLPDGVFVVGYAGRLEHVKGVDILAEAFVRLAEGCGECLLLVAGDGRLRGAMEEVLRREGVKERCRFLGWLDESAMERFYAALDVLVLPSRNEAVGRVLLEAQSRGVPVVASAVGGIPEALCDGVTGLLVPPGSADLLADVLRRLTGDDALRRRMAAAGPGWVRERFAPEKMLEVLSAAYTRAAGGGAE